MSASQPVIEHRSSPGSSKVLPGPHRHNTRRSAVAAWLVFATLVTSCESTGRGPRRGEIVDVGQPALHAVHSARLKRVMADLNNLMFERMPQEWDSDGRLTQRTREAAEVAGAMADAARHIPDVLKEVDIKPRQRDLFVHLADELSAESRTLQTQIEGNQLEKADQTMGRIMATCNDCHTAFRVLPMIVTEPGS